MPLKGQINPAIRDDKGNLIVWKKRNRLAANAAARANRAANPEKIRKQNRAYRENNPFSCATIVAKNRAKQLGVESTLTREEWEDVVKTHNNICHVCGLEIVYKIGHPDRLSLDHIVPMSRGGNNSKDNVAPSHRRCNYARTNMLMSEFKDLVKQVVMFQGL